MVFAGDSPTCILYCQISNIIMPLKARPGVFSFLKVYSHEDDILPLRLQLFPGTFQFRLLNLSHNQTPVQAQAENQALLGFPMPGQSAPDFKLTDQFGQSVTLSSLRGHEVVLAFIDSRCISLCPLTAEIMYNARSRLIASAAKQVVLVAVNANPSATSITIIQSWSIQHGMLHQWFFSRGLRSNSR
jgi:cytochrome oxidase Cu insertion factor (SCO1/SenC/PrrC family)